MAAEPQTGVVDNEGDALMASARSASEVPRNKIGANAAAPLRKSASGATFARLRVTSGPEATPGEPPSPRVQTEVDASYCSYDVTNPKYVGNQSPVCIKSGLSVTYNEQYERQLLCFYFFTHTRTRTHRSRNKENH